MGLTGLNGTSTNVTSWQNFTEFEGIFLNTFQAYISGGVGYILGLLVFAIFLIVAIKSRMPLDASLAIFIPLVFVLSSYGFFPTTIYMLMWVVVGVIVALTLIKIYGGG